MEGSVPELSMEDALKAKRNAYQREYQRKKRLAAKAAKPQHDRGLG